MRVLVTGASGCVGRAVARALLAAGHEVVAAQRDTRAALTILPGIEARAYDAASGADPADLLRGVDALVHLAAAAHIIPRSSAEIERMMRVNAHASASLAAAAERAGVERTIYASSVAVYGAGRATGHAPAPDTPYGESKRAGELPFLRSGGTVLRLSLVFGEGDRGNVAVLARQVKLWGGVVVGDGSNRKSLVYAPHIGDRIVRLLTLPRTDVTGAFDVVDYSPTQRELLSSLAGAVGRKSPPRLPIAPFHLAASAIDVGMRAFGRTPRWRRRVDKLAESTVFSGAELDRVLGFTPPRTLGAALVDAFSGAG